jgi:homoserine O-acetyltransferase
MNYFRHNEAFLLEQGGTLPGLTIAYHTYGSLNNTKDNVVWVCHALTANSDVVEWWPGLVGDDTVLDPSKYFIVCANILGSCYGSTGPLSDDPATGIPFYDSFPMITIRDMVKAHQLLAGFLGIEKIHLLVGGSMGGYQALEWAVMEPEKIKNIFLIATSAKETPWGIAIHTAQRIAIEADRTWNQHFPNAGEKGLKAARAIAMLTYRNYDTYAKTQSDPDRDKIEGFRAASYIHHQGNKLVKRFNAYSYWFLTRAMDSHNIARGRGRSVEEMLSSILQPTLVIGISNDLLCPLPELELLANHIPSSTFYTIESLYGHDGFLTESVLISGYLRQWLQD